MCSTVCFVFIAVCVINTALSSPFESEDIIPVRINGRSSGRFWKRSEEQPRFMLRAFGKDFTLNLIPDTGFIAPSFTIQRIKAKDLSILRSTPGAQKGASFLESDLHKTMNKTEDTDGHLRGCFYSGNVDYNQNSVVAVSLCYGIFGSFITEGEEYLIEPKLLGSGIGSAEQLHVIKRRTFTKTHNVPILFDHPSEESRAKYDGESFTHGEGDAQRESRRKRFVSAPRFIETLVVADSSMTHFYGDEIKVRHNHFNSQQTISIQQTTTVYRLI